MNQPQPLPPRRGAKRVDHGSILDHPIPSDPSDSSGLSGAIGTDSADRTRSGPVEPRRGDALAAGKAAYDARPKVIFRGVDPEIANKLRAIYKHQLRQPNGTEGWSEWGRHLLADIVIAYEAEHGNPGRGRHAATPLRPGSSLRYAQNADSARVAGVGDLALARRSARPLEPLPVAHEGMRCAARYVRPRRVI